MNYAKIERLKYSDFKTQLKPVLSKDDKFDIEIAKVEVIDYLRKILILTTTEVEFVEQFKYKKYRPELLFSNNI